jgi:hypothetical protein
MTRCLRFLIILPLVFLCTKSGDNVAGTATDTNSGSITGLVLNDGKKYQDSVTVSLYSGTTILSKRNVASANLSDNIVTDNGEFRFESLPAGIYSVRITKDSLVIGQELGIVLSKGENKVVNITIIIIINQTFNITNVNNNQNVTINNFYFTGANGYLNTASGGKIVATFTESDTVYITMAMETDKQVDTVTIAFVKNTNGTYSSLPTVTKLPLNVIDGSTVINAGKGSDSSTVTVEGKIREETR